MLFTIFDILSICGQCAGMHVTMAHLFEKKMGIKVHDFTYLGFFYTTNSKFRLLLFAGEMGSKLVYNVYLLSVYHRQDSKKPQTCMIFEYQLIIYESMA